MRGGRWANAILAMVFAASAWAQSTKAVNEAGASALKNYLARYEKTFPKIAAPPSLEQYAGVEKFDRLALGPGLEKRLAHLDNTSASLAWGDSYRMMALNEMYRVTGDTKYLDVMRRYARGVIDARDDKRGRKLWTGEESTVWSCTKYYRGKRTAYGVHTGIIVFPILDFLYLVKQNPAYKAKMGAEFDEILKAMQESLDFHDRQWRDGPAPGEGSYVYRDQDPANDGKPAPINRLSAMGTAYWYSWKVGGNADHRDKALKIGRYFKNRLSLYPDGAYYWPYRLSDKPLTRTLTVAEMKGGEDISHAALSIALPIALCRDGQVFDKADMRRFAATLTQGFGRMGDGIFFSNLATPGNAPSYARETNLWLPLSADDPFVYEKVGAFFLTRNPKPDDLDMAMLLRYKPAKNE